MSNGLEKQNLDAINDPDMIELLYAFIEGRVIARNVFFPTYKSDVDGDEVLNDETIKEYRITVTVKKQTQ